MRKKYVKGSGFNIETTHYTQIAWKETTKVGCSFVVCHYKAQGNIAVMYAKQVCIPSSASVLYSFIIDYSDI